jgi:hypothetical protein
MQIPSIRGAARMSAGTGMTLGAHIWCSRYAAEDRRRLAAAGQRYLAEAGWCLLLAALRAVGGARGLPR